MSERTADSGSNTQAGISRDEMRDLARSVDAEDVVASLPPELFEVTGGDPKMRAKFEKRMAAADIRQQALESLGVTPAAVAKIRQRMERDV